MIKPAEPARLAAAADIFAARHLPGWDVSVCEVITDPSAPIPYTLDHPGRPVPYGLTPEGEAAAEPEAG